VVDWVSIALGGGFALGGAALGFALSEWSMNRRMKRANLVEAGKSAALLGPTFRAVSNWAEGLPVEAASVTDPIAQLKGPPMFTKLEPNLLLASLWTLPASLAQEAAAAILVTVLLRQAVSQARETAERIVGATWAGVGLPWLPPDAGNAQFVDSYASVAVGRALALEQMQKVVGPLDRLSADAMRTRGMTVS
jgi:hypothetical protein